MSYRKQLCARLSEPLAERIASLPDGEAQQLEEIRVYLGCKVKLFFADGQRELPLIPDEAAMKELMAALCGYARYACEQQLAQGYMPLPGGHRVGVCGRVVTEAGMERHVAEVTSVCIRIARHIDGASAPIRRFLLHENGRAGRILLLGTPGCGKTTVLRDAAIWLATECGFKVAVADEREELFLKGHPLSVPVDVLAGIGKAQAMRWLLRSLSPDVMVTDEIGREEDVQVLDDIARCGVGLLATAHASSIEEALGRSAISALMSHGALDRVVMLGRHGSCLDVWERMRMHKEEQDGHGSGCDGVGWKQRNRLCDGGRRESETQVRAGDASQPDPYARTHTV